jgi:hypothetical protein
VTVQNPEIVKHSIIPAAAAGPAAEPLPVLPSKPRSRRASIAVVHAASA